MLLQSERIAAFEWQRKFNFLLVAERVKISLGVRKESILAKEKISLSPRFSIAEQFREIS